MSETSAAGVTVSRSLSVLLLGIGSKVPLPTVTTFVIVSPCTGSAGGLTVAVMVTVWPSPFARSPKSQ